MCPEHGRTKACHCVLVDQGSDLDCWQLGTPGQPLPKGASSGSQRLHREGQVSQLVCSTFQHDYCRAAFHVVPSELSAITSIHQYTLGPEHCNTGLVALDGVF